MGYFEKPVTNNRYYTLHYCPNEVIDEVYSILKKESWNQVYEVDSYNWFITNDISKATGTISYPIFVLSNGYYLYNYDNKGIKKFS